MIVRCEGCFEQFDNKFDICPHCGHSHGEKAEQAFMLDPGTVIADRYVIGNVINYGGFGIIYKCFDRNEDKVLAIKEHFPSQGGLVYRDPNSSVVRVSTKDRAEEFELTKEVFLKEARALAKFGKHPNICNVYNYAEDNNTVYFIMEYLDGMSLSQYIKKKGKLSENVAVNISLSVTKALGAVHKAGIVHRDIAPDNIFLTKDGKVKLIDFGAAKFDDSTIKVDAVKMGFAAPEQYDTKSKQGAFTDIYSLGATIYYMVSGIKPDESRNRLVEDTVQELKCVAEVSDRLSNTVMKAMALNPGLRFKTDEDFAEALKTGMVNGKKVITPDEEKRRNKIKKIVAIISSAAVLAICAAVFFGVILEKNKSVNLSEADIEVWYIGNDENTASAMASLSDSFMTNNKNVTVSVKGVSLDYFQYEYEDAQQSGNIPNIIVAENYNDISEVNTDYNVGNDIVPTAFFDKINNVELSECYLLDDYYSLFSDSKTVPLGINVPMIYVGLNRSAVIKDFRSELSQVTELSSLEKTADDSRLASTHGIYANQNYITPYFNNIYGSIFEMDAEPATASDFNEGKISVYLTSSKENYLLNEKSSLDDLFNGETDEDYTDNSGNQVALPVFSSDGESTPAELTYFCRMNSSTENENNASVAFIRFMLSDSGQNIMFIQNHMSALPINKTTAETLYSKIYTFCESVYTDFDNYEFSILF